jgi:hypothetical protein
MLGRVLHISMYVLKIAKATRNHAREPARRRSGTPRRRRSG